MGYFYLLLALTGGLVKGFSGKGLSRGVANMRDSLFVNLIRMILCALVGAVLLFIDSGLGGFVIGAKELLIFTASAIAMSTFCVCWMLAYRSEAYMFLSIFTMLGSIVTCFNGLIFYNEAISLGQAGGIVLLLVAVFVMSKYNSEVKGRKRFTGEELAVLIIGCLGASLSDFLQKVYVKEIGKSSACFNFYTYLIGAVAVLALFAVFSFGKSVAPVSRQLISRDNIFGYLGISLFLYMNSIFKTMAVAEGLTVAEIFPVLNGANLICSAILANLLFKERISKKSVLGMSLAFVGVVLINLL